LATQPLYVTFDTNAYSVVARPQIGRTLTNFWPLNGDRIQSIINRICWWYLNRCIRKGRIIAGISQASLRLEALRNANRVQLLSATGRRPHGLVVPGIRAEIIRSALAIGMKILHSNRISFTSSTPSLSSKKSRNRFQQNLLEVFQSISLR
jgi:hypothetical protein